jgi:hypothetical protein
MAPRNVGIESTECVVKRIPHCLEMLTPRLQFSAQAKVTLGATGWVRSRGAHVPSAFNIADPIILLATVTTVSGRLFTPRTIAMRKRKSI